MLLLSSITTLAVLFQAHLIGAELRPDSVPWPLWVLIETALVFFLPAVFLGTVPPVVAAAVVAGSDSRGSKLGELYAAGASGSIAGTFLTGYFLVDWFGSRASICGVSILLASLSLACSVGTGKSVAPALWLALACSLGLVATSEDVMLRSIGETISLRPRVSGLVYSDESSFYAIQVRDVGDPGETRVLQLDHLIHSYVRLGQPDDFGYPYENIYASVVKRLYPTTDGVRTLFLGGGGFVLPRYIEQEYPTASIDVVEIDPAVVSAARAALGLPPETGSRINITIADARVFVADQLASPQDARRYDVVFGDVFQDLAVPFHLTTQEFAQMVRSLVGAKNGVYLANVIDINEEPHGRFLGAFVATLSRVFQNVYVFAAAPGTAAGARDTFVCVASDRTLKLQAPRSRVHGAALDPLPIAWSESGETNNRFREILKRAAGIHLTDDYAPVEQLLASVGSAR
jgi:spermidine synthase